MAFGLQAVYAGGTVSLSDKAPFMLHGAAGLGGAPVRRLTSRGPAQHGDTDVGYRLQPRVFTLELGFVASTDAVLDGYRDALMAVFRPSTTPLILRLTRDDGEIRHLDCHLNGKIEIDLLPEHRPGHYHRARVPLYAPESAYYDPTPGTVTVTGAGTAVAADWYLAGGVFGTAQVLMSGGTPAQGEAWSYAGSIPHATSWTLAMRATQEAQGTVAKYAFHVANTGGVGFEDEVLLRTAKADIGEASGYYAGGSTGGNYPLGTGFMTAGTANYFVRHDPSGIEYLGERVVEDDAYNSILLTTYARPIGGTARRWRSDSTNSATSRWTGEIVRYALYSPGLSENQMNTLSAYMTGAIGGTVAQYLSVSYAGDLPEYPIISVRGPITGLRMENIATDDLIALGTIAIASGETYVFDLRPGYKTVKLGTVNKRSALAPYSDWDEFHLTPNTAAGLNPIFIYGTNTSGSTQVSVVYNNRYSSH